jgi:hypothetical protein
VIRFRSAFGAFNTSAAFFLLTAFVLGSPRSALAAANDAEASKIRQAAIEQDYLATDFAAAETKLTQALTLCKDPGSCTPSLRARIHCDFGVVYFAEQKKEEADGQFAAAVKDDPSVTISPDLSTPELQKELAAVKASAGGAEAAPAKSAPESGEASPSPAAKSGPSGSESDCPPGFPGCKAAASGATCSTNDDCNGGETCQNGTCTGESISGSSEAEEEVKPKSNWVSLTFEQEFVLLPSANNVCAGGSGYTCFDAAGTYDKNAPLAGSPVNSDSVGGGFSPANQIIMVGYERAFGANLTLGARVGFAISSAPTRPNGTAFFPLHAELRGTYWFLRNSLARKGFRPYFVLTGGAAEAAASLNAFVYDGTAQPINGQQQTTQYSAWKHVGQAFIGGGLGTAFAFSPTFGIAAELRVMEYLPTTGTGLGLQIGPMLGF